MRVLAIARAAGGGDLHPVVALALGLHRRGHEVRTLCDTAAASVPTELSPFVDEELFATASDRGRDAAAAMNPDAAQDVMFAEYFRTVNREVRDGLRGHIRDVAPDYVVAPLLLAGAAAEATDGSLPWCLVNSTYTLGDDLNAVLRFLSPFFASATLVVHATDEIFDGGRALPPHEHRVGPLFWEPAASLPSYVGEGGPPWVLVAISSVPQGDVAIVPPALAALARHPVRVVATIGPNDATAAGELPPNARLERFVSHLALLERAVLMVSHAGHGSVMKGLWSGVPMVLVPWGRDQPGVAARAERIGIARIVGPSALDELPDAIDAVLRMPSYAEAALRHRERIRASDPVSRACDLVEQSASADALVRGRSALPRDADDRER